MKFAGVDCKLTLQPLIENSIYHGIKEMRGKGIIRIKGWKEKNKVFIQVSDNGLGIPEEKLEELFSKDYREKGSAFGLLIFNKDCRFIWKRIWSYSRK